MSCTELKNYLRAKKAEKAREEIATEKFNEAMGLKEEKPEMEWDGTDHAAKEMIEE